VVRVPSRSSVNDRLPAAGRFNATSRFPQYFTSAIFVPATAVTARGGLMMCTFPWTLTLSLTLTLT
jgi:hypothetical protein